LTLTIDTQVLCLADKFENPEHDAVFELLRTIRRDGHFIAVDYGGKILGEYRSNLGEYGTQWLKRMSNEKGPHGYRIQHTDGRVPNRQRRKLVEELHFHRKDLVFVGVASHTGDRFLVAHESDYTPDVCQYLAECELCVRVCRAEEAEAECQACT